MIKFSHGLKAICATLALAILPLNSVAAPDGERFIVKFQELRSAGGLDALWASGADVVRELANHNAVAAHIPAAALQGLQRNPNIEYIETDEKRYMTSLQNEEITPYGITMVRADLVGEYSLSDKTLCIIDSGLDITHPDFAGNSNIFGSWDSSGSGSWDNDEVGHGTHVAGTILAAANGSGVVGVNPDGHLNVHIVKIFGEGSDGPKWVYSSDLIDALGDCESAGADVVNMSLGGSGGPLTEERAFAKSARQGVLLIAAAGNDGDTQESYPASYDSVISVAALDSNRNIADWSQKNTQVELAAPGVAVLSTVPVGTGRDATVSVGSASYAASGLEGSPLGDKTGILVNCGTGETSCSAAGAVCLIQRGNITFAEKVTACESYGGIGVIIYNDVPGNFSGTLDGVATSIPSVSVSDTDGSLLLTQIPASATVAVSATDYATWDGTSLATSHVSGVAALIWNNASGCNAEDVRYALAATAEDLGAIGRDSAYGYGLIQADSALALLSTENCGNNGSDPGGGGNCELGQPGDSCSRKADCCSGSCKGGKGQRGVKTCR